MDINDDSHENALGPKEMPDDLSPQNLRTIFGKARRGTIIRTVGISVISFVILAFAGCVADSMWTSRIASQMEPVIARELSLQDPDVNAGSYLFSQSFLGGRIDMRTFKLIDGTPIPWATSNFDYNVFGDLSLPFAGDLSPAPQIETSEGMRLYNDQTEQRIMEFYLPGVAYTQHFNDLASIGQIPHQDKVEMAISFNRDYTFQAVNAMLPAVLKPTWYWVDTYSAGQHQEKNAFPYLSGEDIWGFPRQSIPGPSTPKETPADFLITLKAGLHGPTLWQWQDRQILKTLAPCSGNPTATDVKISGVVITGTPGALKQLQGKPYVRASSLGAIAQPY